jgi:hypothetical protein
MTYKTKVVWVNVLILVLFIGLGVITANKCDTDRSNCLSTTKFHAGDMVHIKGFSRQMRVESVEQCDLRHYNAQPFITYRVINDDGIEHEFLEDQLEK